MLRFDAETSARVNAVVPADRRPAFNDDMRTDNAAVANLDVFPDHCEGPDFHIGSNASFRMDDRGGVNVGTHRHDVFRVPGILL